MKVYIEKDYQKMSERAASFVASAIQAKPHLVLGLATGSTPFGTYREWVNRVQDGVLSFKDITTFNLDEYLGMPTEHPQSYRTFMDKNLFRWIDVNPEHTHIPNGDTKDVDQQCVQYERAIQQSGGIDIQVLGIGKNGHIGFNEPGEDFGKLTHVVQLSETTRQANARFFPRLDDVPTHAITMGLKSIMNARQVVLLASGEDKSEAVYQALYGDVHPDHPASVLQLHPNCVFILDELAASKLPSNAGNVRLELVK